MINFLRLCLGEPIDEDDVGKRMAGVGKAADGFISGKVEPEIRRKRDPFRVEERSSRNA